MTQPSYGRRIRRRRTAILATLAASTVAAALGAWVVAAGPASADDVGPDVVTSLHVEQLYDYGAVGRIRLPAPNALHVEGLLVDPLRAAPAAGGGPVLPAGM